MWVLKHTRDDTVEADRHGLLGKFRARAFADGVAEVVGAAAACLVDGQGPVRGDGVREFGMGSDAVGGGYLA